jgi:ParB family protein of integrating conjugative element (PFGI_1 class)
MTSKTRFAMPLSVKPSDIAKPSKADLARQHTAMTSLSVVNPANNSGMVMPLGNDTNVCRVALSAINTYERNPRTSLNEAYAEIKASMRITGPDGVIQITQVPGRTGYVCAKGANTRLAIAKELRAEELAQTPPGNRWEFLLCQIVPWTSHAAAIADHVKENVLRGDMTFWDKAKACLAIRDEIQAETGSVLNNSALADVVNNKYGLSIDRPTLVRYIHCVEHFQAIGSSLSNLIVKELMPASNELVRLAVIFELTEEQAWEHIHHALENFAETRDTGKPLDVAACGQAMRSAMTVSLKLTAHQMDFALTALAHSPKAVKADLLTSPEPAAAVQLLSRPSDAGEGGDNGDAGDTGLFADGVLAGQPSGAHQGGGASPESRQKRDPQPMVTSSSPTAQNTPTAGFVVSQGASSSVVEPSGSPVTATDTKPRASMGLRELDVGTAIDEVIEAINAFCISCGIDRWVVTGTGLPYGFYMEIVDSETEGIPALVQPSNECPDNRIRVAAWWLCAGLCHQCEEQETLLLPEHSHFRRMWLADGNTAIAPGEGNLYDAIQLELGAVLSDAGTPALQIEHITALASDISRLSLWFRVCQAVYALTAARNRVSV